MKKISFLAVAAIVMMGVAFAASCDSKKSIGSVKIKNDADSVCFIIGQSHGLQIRKGFEEQVKSWPLEGNIEAFIAGFIYGLQNPDDTLLLGKDMQAAGEYVNGIFMNAQEKISEAGRAEATKFLAENATKSGVITTQSGLQYKVVTEGKGSKPTETDVVRVNYIGTELDGTEFDSSEKHGGPAEFPVGGVIAGWTEGLKLMPVGSKYIFWVPSSLAYDAAGPNHPHFGKLLVFEVELLEILK